MRRLRRWANDAWFEIWMAVAGIGALNAYFMADGKRDNVFLIGGVACLCFAVMNTVKDVRASRANRPVETESMGPKGWDSAPLGTRLWVSRICLLAVPLLAAIILLGGNPRGGMGLVFLVASPFLWVFFLRQNRRARHDERGS